MNNEIKYVCYYDIPENQEDNRRLPLSALSIVECICECLESQQNKTVEIVSAAASDNRGGCKGKNVQISEKRKLKTFASFGKRNRILSRLDRIWINIKIFLYMLFHTSRNDCVIVYHSLYYMRTIRMLKRLKRLRLVLQVEEIYGDVISDLKRRKKELKYFEIADAYIFPTELLNQVVNLKQRPYAIIHGTYKIEEERNIKRIDDKIHVVYAGTFDSRKGAIAAVESAAYLPRNYCIHILGFGSSEEISLIKETIEKNKRVDKAELIYEGCLSGEEYIKFLQGCQIGICTQNPNAAFNSTSFPSKILSYMSNGLRVVSINIPAVKESKVGEQIWYYENQSPKDIAATIEAVTFDNGYDGREIVKKLLQQFAIELIKIVND